VVVASHHLENFAAEWTKWQVLNGTYKAVWDTSNTLPHNFTPAEAPPLSCTTGAHFLLTGFALRDAYRNSSAILEYTNPDLGV